MPIGFLLGDVGSAEGDSSLDILLVPFGAVLLLLAAIAEARGLVRR